MNHTEPVTYLVAAAQPSPDHAPYDWLCLLSCGHLVGVRGEVTARHDRAVCPHCRDGFDPQPLPASPSQWLADHQVLVTPNTITVVEVEP